MSSLAAELASISISQQGGSACEILCLQAVVVAVVLLRDQ